LLKHTVPLLLLAFVRPLSFPSLERDAALTSRFALFRAVESSEYSLETG